MAAALALCCADPARVAPEVVARHVYVAEQRAEIAGADRDFLSATRSVAATVLPGHSRAFRRAVNSISCPVLLVHGDRDRLVPVKLARVAARAHPAWSAAVLSGVGHVPMLETPRATARLITEWIQGPGRDAAVASGHHG